MKKYKSVAACFKALKLDVEKNLPVVTHLPEEDRKAVVSHYKIMKVIQAHNENRKPNWNDSSEYKYYPWWDVEASAKQPSGSGLSCHDFDLTNAFTNVSSRLCVFDSETCRHLASVKEFVKLYEEYMLYNS